jgi:hypothetical protein
MDWTAILIGLGLIAVILAVAYGFAVREQKSMRTGPVDLDPDEQEARRRIASGITNIGNRSGSGM